MMNRGILLSAFAAVLLMGACTAKLPIDPITESEANEPQGTEPQVLKETIVLSAYSADDAGTKSSRDASGNFYWSPNDAISVFYGSGVDGGNRFEATCTEPVQTADFSGTMDENREPGHQYWAIYPYNVRNKWDEDNRVLTTEIPSHQVAAEGTFADGQFISIGHSDTPSIGFYHLCGGFKFFLSTEGITRITLQGKGQPLSGLVEVKMDEYDRPYVNDVLEPSNEIVLTPPAGETTFKTGNKDNGPFYFFVTMPTSFTNGFDIVFEKSGTVGARLVSNNLTVNRAKFQWSTVSLDNGVSFATLEEPDLLKTNVRKYMDYEGYNNNSGDPDASSNPGYTYSVFKQNSYTSTYKYQYGDDQPQKATLLWSGSADKVWLSTSPTYEDAQQITPPSSAGGMDIYNLIPGVVYYYKATSGNEEVGHGCFRPKGFLRQIYLSNMTGNAYSGNGTWSDNIRDLGGWKAENNKTIRYGKLYRGAQIDKFINSEPARDNFKNLGIGYDMELRGGKSTDKKREEYYNNRPIPDIEWDQYPVIKFMGIAENKPGLTAGLYRQAIKSIINFLQTDGRAIYFHCEGGADRTGTLAFLIEAILGVSESDMSKDFELTTFTYKNKRFRHVDSSFSTDEKKYPYKDLIRYMRTFEGTTMQEKVTNWAKMDDPNVTGDDALTDTDIAQLKALLLE